MGPALCAFGLAISTAVLVPAVGQERSEIKRLAPQSLLLGVDSVEGLIAAVGERGHVLLSRDDGRTWKQVSVPTQVTLTAVDLLDPSHGCAVGHDAVVLCTSDGGEIWSLVHISEGKDLPLLDVHLEDRQRAIAVGAYGTVLRTIDGGVTWTEESLALENDESGGDDFWMSDFHLNDVGAGPEGTLFIAAEAGTLYRAIDGSKTWAEIPSPYEGSFFGVLGTPTGRLLTFGLRGHLFRSDDGGASWSAFDTGTDALLTTGLVLPDSRLLVSGLSGVVLIADPEAERFELRGLPGREGIADGTVTSEGALVLVGDFGILRMTPAELLELTKPDGSG